MKQQTQQFYDFESKRVSFEKEDKLVQAIPYLEKHANPNDIQSISELHGFLSAAACVPTISSVDQWLEFMFEELWESDKDKAAFSSLLSELYSEIEQEYERGDNTMAVFLDGSGEPIVDDWCAGFCRGTHLWHGLSKAQSLGIQMKFAPIALFGDPVFRIPTRSQDPRIKLARDSILEITFEIYTALRASNFGRKRKGRNAKCFCGSGKKYKKCCLRKTNL